MSYRNKPELLNTLYYAYFLKPYYKQLNLNIMNSKLTVADVTMYNKLYRDTFLSIHDFDNFLGRLDLDCSKDIEQRFINLKLAFLSIRNILHQEGLQITYNTRSIDDIF